MSEVSDTLETRGHRYGRFIDNAAVSQSLQDALKAANPAAWELLAPDMKEALTVIMQKIARILNGDPLYEDNWHDIQGYAKLVEDRILHRGAYAHEQPSHPAASMVDVPASNGTLPVDTAWTEPDNPPAG